MNYWYERNAEIQRKLTNQTLAKMENQLKREYRIVSVRLVKDMELLYNDFLSTIKEGEKPSASKLYALDRYWEFQSKLQKELQRLGDHQSFLFLKGFADGYESLYKGLSLPFKETMRVSLDTKTIETAVKEIWCSDGKSWSERIWTNIEGLRQTLNEELLNCVVTGSKPATAKKILQERFSVSFNEADRIVRTELGHIQTSSTKKRYKDAGVKQVKFIASPSERTCGICGRFDGKIIDIDLLQPGVNCAPLHPNCRCCIIPIVD